MASPIIGTFTTETVPQACEDPLYGLMREYRQDANEKKIDLGIGAYRGDDGKPWILPVVRKAEEILRQDPNSNHEYLPIQGLDTFLTAAQKLLLGEDSPVLKEKRICTLQTVSGTGAVHLGATFLSRFHPRSPSVFISDPTWPNHMQIFSQAGLTVEYYPYYSKETKGLNIDAMLGKLEAAPSGSIVILQACAHNPTGIDPTQDQWKRISTVIRERGHFPFFDCAYQGFASGDLIRDSWAVRFFIEQGFEMCIAQSFAKNLGLYGERAGVFHFISAPSEAATQICSNISSQLAIIQRAEISNPPSYGAKIANCVLNSPDLFAQWEKELLVMSGRLSGMRQQIRQELEARGTPGSWEFLSSQTGMFSFTGLTQPQVLLLKEKWHIYMTNNGRISVAGLNSKNIDHFIAGVDDVVRSCQ